MPLKFRYKGREEIPAEHQALYVERDGGFVLDVEGAVEKTRLDQFRSTNVALRREVESLNTRLADNSVESMVLQVASKFGVRAAALPDLTNRARQIFRMVDGELRPLQRDGKSPVLGADGANAISFEEWVTRQVAEASHLWLTRLRRHQTETCQEILTANLSDIHRHPSEGKRQEATSLFPPFRLRKNRVYKDHGAGAYARHG